MASNSRPASATSDNYLSVLPLLLSGRVRLLDNTTLRTQLAALERRVGAGDHEIVSCPQLASAHDDLATAACGALVSAAQRPAYSLDAFGDPARPDAFWNALQWANYFRSWECRGHKNGAPLEIPPLRTEHAKRVL